MIEARIPIVSDGMAVRLRLLGVPCALLDGREVQLPARVALLLALLTLDGPQARGQAATWVYPDAEPAAARRNLRQILHRHHGVLSGLVETSGEHLQLRPTVQVDALRLIDLRRRTVDDAPPSLAALLGTLRFDPWPEFQEWLDGQRVRLRLRGLDQLLELAAACEAAGQFVRAQQLTEQLLAEEPISEHGHRRAMRLHYLRGDRAAALAAFDRCERLLKDELGARPAAETLDLLRVIEAADALPAPSVARHRPLPVSLRRPPHLVGRDAELAALAAAWRDGAAFLVMGEAGIGKSRLIGDHALQHTGALVVRARHGDAQRPYATLARLLSQLPDLQRLQLHQRELIAMLCQGSSEAELHDERANSESIHAAVSVALSSDCVHPVIDDLHLADDATLELLTTLIADGPPGSPQWGLSSRPHDGRAWLDLRSTLQDRGRLRVCRLGPLDSEQLAALVESLQLPRAFGAGPASLLMRRGGGNPMFTLELLKGWLSAPEKASFEDLDTPQEVALLLDQQLSACSPRALMLARLAALAANDFSVELAEAVLGESALELVDAWRELDERQLMRDGQFAHDLVHEAALRSVPGVIAATVHARIAPWLADRGGSAGSIAAHWIAGGQDRQAVEPLCQAARQAIAAGRIREAGQRYEQAAAILQRQGQTEAAFDRWFDACEMYVDAADRAAYDAATAQAIPLARSAANGVRAKLMQAFGAYMRGDLAAAQAMFTPLLDEAIAVGERRTEAECRFEIARGLAHEGRLREALRMVAPAVTIFRELGLPARELEARRAIKGITARTGLDFATGSMPLSEPMRLAADTQEGLDRRTRKPTHWTFPARMAANAGEFARAASLLDEVFDDITALNLVPAIRYSALAMSLGTLADLGRYGQALELLRRHDERSDPYRGEYWRDLCIERAALWHALGRPEQARFAEVAVDRPASTHQADEENLQRRVRDALALLPSLPASAAAVEIEPLVQRLGAAGFAAWRPSLQALQALRLAELGDTRFAQIAGEAERELERLAMPSTVAQACVWLANAWQRGGDASSAQRIAQWGRNWLLNVALPKVPDLFHDSYLRRKPVNAELQFLAQGSPALG